MVPSDPMRIFLGWALALLLAGCGGDEEAATAIGLWGLERPDGCAVLLRVTADEQCRWGVVCELVTGEIGLERTEGSCTLAGGWLETAWERSTCADPAELRSRYTVDEDQLTLEGSDGHLVFRRLDESGDGEPSTGIVRYGCWQGDTLVFSALQPL